MHEPDEPYRPTVEGDPLGNPVTYTYNVSSEEIRRGAEARQKARVGEPLQLGLVTTITYVGDRWKRETGDPSEVAET